LRNHNQPIAEKEGAIVSATGFPISSVFSVRGQSKGLMGGSAFAVFRIRFPFFVRRSLGQYMPVLQIQSV
jgi:hypothetical protein